MKLLKDLDVYSYRKGWSFWTCLLIPLIYTTTWPIIVYRLGSWIVNLRCKPLRVILYILYFPLKRIIELLTTIEISERAVIGEGLFLAHLGTIIIGHGARIGKYASIHQEVTIGGGGKGGVFPVLGDNAYLGAGCKIIGPVKIGNNVVVGANSVVVTDIPDDAVVVGIPGKVLNYNSSMEFIHYRNK